MSLPNSSHVAYYRAAFGYRLRQIYIVFLFLQNNRLNFIELPIGIEIFLIVLLCDGSVLIFLMYFLWKIIEIIGGL